MFAQLLIDLGPPVRLIRLRLAVIVGRRFRRLLAGSWRFGPGTRRTARGLVRIRLVLGRLQRLADGAIGPLALLPVRDDLPRAGAMLNRTVSTHLTIGQVQQDILHRLTVRNVTLLLGAVSVSSFLAFCRVNQNNQLILNHFPLVRITRTYALATLVLTGHLLVILRRLIWSLLLGRLLLLLWLITHVLCVHSGLIRPRHRVLVHVGPHDLLVVVHHVVRVHIARVHVARLAHVHGRPHIGHVAGHAGVHPPLDHILLVDIS